MNEFTLGSGVTAHYTSFEEAAKDFGCKPVVKKTKDGNKLTSQREKFAKHHKCRACGKPMVLIPGTNVFTCDNPHCKGIKVDRKGEDGAVLATNYITSYDLLDEQSTEIANNIFKD